MDSPDVFETSGACPSVQHTRNDKETVGPLSVLDWPDLLARFEAKCLLQGGLGPSLLFQIVQFFLVYVASVSWFLFVCWELGMNANNGICSQAGPSLQPSQSA